MSHAVRLTIDPQNSTTEVNSGVESGTQATVGPVVLFTSSRPLQTDCVWVKSIKTDDVRWQTLMASTMNIILLWFVAPCSLVENYRLFGWNLMPPV
jgi:hypothetical protein